MANEIMNGPALKLLTELRESHERVTAENATLRSEILDLRNDRSCCEEAARPFKEELDSLRNFLGDMTIKHPVGRVIGTVAALRARHNPEVCVEVQEYADKLRDANAQLKVDLAAAREALAAMELLFSQRPPAAVPTAPTQKHESGLVPVMQARNMARAVIAAGGNKGPLSPEELFGEHAHDGAAEAREERGE